MQKSENTHTTRAVHKRLRSSTTLSRKYVKRPAGKISDISKSTNPLVRSGTTPADSKKRSPMISRFGLPTKKKVVQSEKIRPASTHPAQALANKTMRERQRQYSQQNIVRPTAKELKDQAIKKALQAASRQSSQGSSLAQQAQTREIAKKKSLRFGPGRIVLALSCAVAAVFAIVYFVNLNMPDIQFKATAAQLDATYPGYVPYGYSPVSISSEGSIITLSFEDHSGGGKFIVTEEKSSWDSNSLLNNFVKNDFGEDYSIVREQGLTIYVGNNRAAWVNGGIVYKLNMIKGTLSKKQISSIAVSF